MSQPDTFFPVVPPAIYAGTECKRSIKIATHKAFPNRTDGLCRCGCGRVVTAPARCWARPLCSINALKAIDFVIGTPAVIRTELRRRDGGVCAACNRDTEAELRERYEEWMRITFRGRVPSFGYELPYCFTVSPWDCHHVVPVEKGGARLGLSNFRTLCKACHRLENKARKCRSRSRK